MIQDATDFIFGLGHREVVKVCRHTHRCRPVFPMDVPGASPYSKICQRGELDGSAFSVEEGNVLQMLQRLSVPILEFEPYLNLSTFIVETSKVNAPHGR